MDSRQCQYCDQTFNKATTNGKVFANHVKWCKKNPSSPTQIKCEHCAKDVNSLALKRHIEACTYNPKNARLCPVCDEIIADPENSFCSSSCFAINHNATNTLNVREKGYKFEKAEEICKNCEKTMLIPINAVKDLCDDCMLPSQTKTFVCEFCQIPFDVPYWLEKQTCSEECYKQLLSKKSRENPNCGGETNFYHYKYKGITMDSSWEVALAEFLDKKNVKWVRTHSMWFPWKDSTGKIRRYHPDFYLPDFKLYLDPKNKKKLEDDMSKLSDVVKTHEIDLIVGEIKKFLRYLEQVLVDRKICKGLVVVDSLNLDEPGET